MKQTAIIIFLISINFILSAQTSFKDIERCVISYNGDTTLLIEKYEIDIKKEKVFYITPIMNFLHIKGVKYRTPIKIKKQKWGEILMSAKSLYDLTPPIKVNQTNDTIIYSVDFYNTSESIKGFVFYNETIPQDLKRLFDTIRNND